MQLLGCARWSGGVLVSQVCHQKGSAVFLLDGVQWARRPAAGGEIWQTSFTRRRDTAFSRGTHKHLTFSGMTSRNSSGNILEMVLGLMYLGDMMLEMDLRNVFEISRLREMQWAYDLWSRSYGLLLHVSTHLHQLSLWRAPLDVHGGECA